MYDRGNMILTRNVRRYMRGAVKQLFIAVIVILHYGQMQYAKYATQLNS